MKKTACQSIVYLSACGQKLGLHSCLIDTPPKCGGWRY